MLEKVKRNDKLEFHEDFEPMDIDDPLFIHADAQNKRLSAENTYFRHALWEVESRVAAILKNCDAAMAAMTRLNVKANTAAKKLSPPKGKNNSGSEA